MLPTCQRLKRREDSSPQVHRGPCQDQLLIRAALRQSLTLSLFASVRVLRRRIWTNKNALRHRARHHRFARVVPIAIAIGGRVPQHLEHGRWLGRMLRAAYIADHGRTHALVAIVDVGCTPDSMVARAYRSESAVTRVRHP
jgi:hypothetical protein